MVLPAGYRGLNYFPDEPIAIIRQQPFTFLMTAGNATYLMVGSSLRTAVPVEKVLIPGAKGSFDNGYAGAGSVYLDEGRGEVLVFYHAEDHEGMPMVSYNKAIHGAYWSIGLAVAKTDSTHREKVGPNSPCEREEGGGYRGTSGDRRCLRHSRCLTDVSLRLFHGPDTQERPIRSQCENRDGSMQD